MAESKAKLSENARKFLSSEQSDTLEPPGKDLTISDNFFNVDDMDDALNIFDIDQMDGVMQTWRQEAHKKIKKRPSVAVEYRPEDTKEEVIGGTLIADDNRTHQLPQPQQQRQLPSSQQVVTEPQSLPVSSQDIPKIIPEEEHSHSLPRGSVLPKSRTSENMGTLPVEVPPAPPATLGFKAPSIKQTIDMILIGQPYVLEWYKSLEEKRALLQEAIRTHDGNAIITIILFLRNTLSKSLFEVLLLNNPVAATHYCSFLRQNEAWEQLKSVYYVQGEESYGILQYQLCLAQENLPRRISTLESCKILFDKKPSLSKDAMFIDEYIRLLKRQKNIEAFKASRIVIKYQGPPLLDTTLITTLTYCCRYHLNNPESADVNPEEFRKDFNVSERQYFITLLVSLCANRDWDTIDRLLTPKGWQSKLKLNTKIKAPVSVERVINVIGKSVFRAPEEMLSKYIRMIDDLEKRFEVATRLQCYGVGVEVLKQLKDNKRLKNYLSQIPVDKQRKYRPMLAKMFS